MTSGRATATGAGATTCSRQMPTSRVGTPSATLIRTPSSSRSSCSSELTPQRARVYVREFAVRRKRLLYTGA
eukprot:3592892-Prymnesium_polylepis.1